MKNLIKSENRLKAAAVNNFLVKCVLNESEYNYNNPGDLEIIVGEVKKAVEDNEEFKEDIVELDKAWNSTFITKAIQVNRRTVPYTVDEVTFATSLNRDILNFSDKF